MDLAAIQSALRARNISAWLFYDHHHRDPIAYRVLGLPEKYSPNNGVFTISLVDAGTADLIRGLGKNILSSGDLVALFEATWNEAQIQSHFAARDSVDAITAAAFQEIGRRVRSGGTNEFEIQQWIMEAFSRENLVTSDAPVVAVNRNSGNPHYGPDAANSSPIREGDFVLLDIWAKKNTPNAVYYDITWTGFVGPTPTARMREIFDVVRTGRDAGIKFVQDSIAAGGSARRAPHSAQQLFFDRAGRVPGGFRRPQRGQHAGAKRRRRSNW